MLKRAKATEYSDTKDGSDDVDDLSDDDDISDDDSDADDDSDFVLMKPTKTKKKRRLHTCAELFLWCALPCTTSTLAEGLVKRPCT
eukprot:scaffold6270_cov162-Amphora_coffeaeformis.AAC.4